MTLDKVYPKFKCNIYSDIDFQSVISVSSTRNSQSFTVLTDRLAFVSFSSPGIHKVCQMDGQMDRQINGQTGANLNAP